MNSTFVRSLLACSLALPLLAFAEDKHIDENIYIKNWTKGWYIGAGFNGNPEFLMNNGSSDALPDFSGTEVELNSSNTGFEVYLGRQVSDHWATEFGYTYVGNITFEAEDEATEVVTDTATVKQWNLHYVGVGRLPVAEHVDFMFKGGLAWYYSSNKFHQIDPEVITHANYRGFALTYGAGVEIFWDQFFIRADYTIVSPPSDVQEDFYVSDIVSLSLAYKFVSP